MFSWKHENINLLKGVRKTNWLSFHLLGFVLFQSCFVLPSLSLVSVSKPQARSPEASGSWNPCCFFSCAELEYVTWNLALQPASRQAQDLSRPQTTGWDKMQSISVLEIGFCGFCTQIKSNYARPHQCYSHHPGSRLAVVHQRHQPHATLFEDQSDGIQFDHMYTLRSKLSEQVQIGLPAHGTRNSQFLSCLSNHGSSWLNQAQANLIFSKHQGLGSQDTLHFLRPLRLHGLE